MGSPKESLIYDIKLSSVGREKVTGENVVHRPTSMDLAMKLHYLRGVYFFSKHAVEGLTIFNFKEFMNKWLEFFYPILGRFRRSETGRPFIKCNDCGVRVIEAKCIKSVDEWLDLRDYSLHKLLVPYQVLGPELQFSPPVFIQFTLFKCGGMSLGLSLAHVLGDVFSASNFLNMLGQIMAGHDPSPTSPPQSMEIEQIPIPLTADAEPISLKRVDPVGDHWVFAGNWKMETYSFHITIPQLNLLQSKTQTEKLSYFDSICAVFWKSIAKVRNWAGPKIVTLIREKPFERKHGSMNNNQVVSVLQVDISIDQAEPKQIAELIIDGAVEERRKIEAAVEKDHGSSDYIMYGSNLTFVDLEGISLYELQIQGQKPIFANYIIDGIGEEGAVLILPGPMDTTDEFSGRSVTVSLPENQMFELKGEMKREWSIT